MSQILLCVKEKASCQALSGCYHVILQQLVVLYIYTTAIQLLNEMYIRADHLTTLPRHLIRDNLQLLVILTCSEFLLTTEAFAYISSSDLLHQAQFGCFLSFSGIHQYRLISLASIVKRRYISYFVLISISLYLYLSKRYTMD